MDTLESDLQVKMYQYIQSGGDTLPEGVTKEKIEQYIKQEQKRNKQIEKQLLQESKGKNEIVLLLLGTGESGKSTVAKQFRLINHNEYSQQELSHFVSIIHSNILSSIRSAIKFAEEHDMKLESSSSEAETLMKMEVNSVDQQAAQHISKVLNDPIIKSIMENPEFTGIDDGSSYFLDHVERVSNASFTPTSADILHARQKSTGIIETQFVNNGALFRIVDVGGQRSERKKWSRLFSDVTGIIFCADSSAYDLTLREDPNQNRMLDSIQTFSQICNNRDLQSRDIILFLNKTDLLQKRLKTSPLTSCFPEASPNATFDEALQFIESKYVAQNTNPNKLVFVHKTIATDTENITTAFTAIVREIVRKDNVLASF